MTSNRCQRSWLRLNRPPYTELHQRVLKRDGWRCQSCGCLRNLQVHHIQSRGRLGDDTEENLITLCASCHERIHLTLTD